LIVFVGTRQWHSWTRVHRFGDPSYGIYLYAFPIQQTLVLAGIRGAWSLFLAATPITVAFGYASWHVIERPAMRRMRGLGPRTAPPPSVAHAGPPRRPRPPPSPPSPGSRRFRSGGTELRRPPETQPRVDNL